MSGWLQCEELSANGYLGQTVVVVVAAGEKNKKCMGLIVWLAWRFSMGAQIGEVHPSAFKHTKEGAKRFAKIGLNFEAV